MQKALKISQLSHAGSSDVLVRSNLLLEVLVLIVACFPRSVIFPYY